MRLENAYADAAARGRVRRHRTSTDIFLASTRTPFRRVAAGMDRFRFAGTAAHARWIEYCRCCAGGARSIHALPARETKRIETRRNLGLRLCRANTANAIYRRIVRGNYYQIVQLDFAAGTSREIADEIFSDSCRL